MLSKLLVIISLFMLTNEFGFTPSSLYAYYTEEYILNPARREYSNKIIDPDNFLREYDRIMEKINTVEKEKKLHIFVIFIKELDRSYSSMKTNPIKAFGYKFAEIYFQNDKDMKANSMMIVFSVEDKKMRISVGDNLRDIYTSFYNRKIKESLFEDLKSHNFDKACIDMLDEILNFEEFKKTISPIYNAIKYIAGGALGILVMIFFMRYLKCCFCCLEKTVTYNVDEIDYFLKGLDRSKEKGKEKEYGNDYCLICLGKINEDRRTNFDKEPVDIELEEIKDDKSSKMSDGIMEKLGQRDTEENEKVVLECKHNFHQGCLDLWRKRSQECPICREKMGDFVNDVHFREGIITIHKSSRHELHKSNLVIENDKYVAIKRVPIWVKGHHHKKNNEDNGITNPNRDTK